jgi:hypothetical protein
MRNHKGEYVAGGMVGGCARIFTEKEMQSPEFIAPLRIIKKFIDELSKEKNSNEQDNYTISSGNVAHFFSGATSRGGGKKDTRNRKTTTKQ